MDATITVPVLVLGLTGIGQLGALLIWGATLSNRVKQIEREIEPLKMMGISVARMETRIENMIDQLRDLNASIRWMRDPAADNELIPRPRLKP